MTLACHVACEIKSRPWPPMTCEDSRTRSRTSPVATIGCRGVLHRRSPPAECEIPVQPSEFCTHRDPSRVLTREEGQAPAAPRLRNLDGVAPCFAFPTT